MVLGVAELGKREVVNAVKTLPGVSQVVQAKGIADMAPKMATPQGRKELAGQAAKMLESGSASAVRATHKSMKEGNTLDVALAEGFVAYTEKVPFVAGVADTMRKAEQALKANDTKEGAKQLVIGGGEFGKGVAETTLMFEGVTSGGGGAGAAAPEGTASSWRNDPVWIKGQTTRPATSAETLRFQLGLRRGNVEVSFTQFDNRAPALRIGDTSSVPVPGGPNVTSTSHTHPAESPAIYSAGDYQAYTTGGYGPNTTHTVTARKWPLTNQFLQTLGLSVETELVTTEITQAEVEVNAAARPHSFWDWLQRNPF
jgi:hypothetical protein